MKRIPKSQIIKRLEEAQSKIMKVYFNGDRRVLTKSIDNKLIKMFQDIDDIISKMR